MKCSNPHSSVTTTIYTPSPHAPSHTCPSPSKSQSFFLPFLRSLPCLRENFGSFFTALSEKLDGQGRWGCWAWLLLRQGLPRPSTSSTLWRRGAHKVVLLQGTHCWVHCHAPLPLHHRPHCDWLQEPEWCQSWWWYLWRCWHPWHCMGLWWHDLHPCLLHCWHLRLVFLLQIKSICHLSFAIFPSCFASSHLSLMVSTLLFLGVSAKKKMLTWRGFLT